MESKKLKKSSKNTMEADFEVSVLNILKKESRDFLTVSRIKQKVPIHLLKDLKLKRSSSNSSFVKKIKPYLNGKLSYYRSRYSYIGHRKSDEGLIRSFLADKDISAKKAASLIPLTKNRFARALNKLIADGIVIVSLNEKIQIFIRSVPLKHRSDKEIFEELCNLNHGRSFIRIHRIREEALWETERFDRVLKSLAVGGKIQLLGGDPTELTKDEIENSYVDSKGRLRIMVTWRDK